jgi:hypothetical protein
MEITAYRALEANRWRSRLLAAFSAALMTSLVPLPLWLLGADGVRPVSTMFIALGSMFFGVGQRCSSFSERVPLGPKRNRAFSGV